MCRSPVKDIPCHKRCAEAWITGHAASAAHRARLIRGLHPWRGWPPPASFRVIYHEPICPDCGSSNITTDEVETTDGLTETALTCRACGEAWPWPVSPTGAAGHDRAARRHLHAPLPPAYRHARHYVGWTPDLLHRLDCHAAGHGARLVAVIWQAGIGFTGVAHLRRHPPH